MISTTTINACPTTCLLHWNSHFLVIVQEGNTCSNLKNVMHVMKKKLNNIISQSLKTIFSMILYVVYLTFPSPLA
jgi:hypothetical protein